MAINFIMLRSLSRIVSNNARTLQSKRYAHSGMGKVNCLMLDLISSKLIPNASAIDIGCGENIDVVMQMALQTMPSSEANKVVGIDRSLSRIERGIDKVRKSVTDMDILKRMVLTPGDGVGDWNPGSPFDVIRIGFALPSLECEEMKILKMQMKRGGRMVVPMFVDASDPNSKVELVVVDKIRAEEFTITRKSIVENSPNLFNGRRIGTMKRGLKIEDETEGERRVRMSKESRKESVKRDLDKWRNDFHLKHKRKPTRADLENDPAARDLFEQFSKL